MYFVSSCTSNLISLEQLQNSDISYQDENSKMTLTKMNVLWLIQQVENLFILNILKETLWWLYMNEQTINKHQLRTTAVTLSTCTCKCCIN
jgi:hypothetical protein